MADVQPISMTRHQSRYLTRVRDDVDSYMIGWDNFQPQRKWFSDLKKPVDTFRQYVSDKFEKPGTLWRSASASSLNFDDSMKAHFGGLRRSESYTSLNPSAGMDFKDRYVPRYVNQFQVYKTKASDWLHENILHNREKSFDAQMKARSKARAEKQKARSQPAHMPVYHTPPTSYSASNPYDFNKWLPAHHRSSYIVTRPTSITRLQADDFRFKNRLTGVRYASPWLNTSVQLDDDRLMHRLHWGARTQSSCYGPQPGSRAAAALNRPRRTLMCY